MTIPTRPFGRTGVDVTIVALGCGTIGFNNVTHEEGVGVVRHALDQGINYIDTAHYYGSERIVGDALEGRRDGVFLVTKTLKRNKAAAWRDIQTSLRSLKTDRIDLLHMHCVNTIGDLDAVCGLHGSLEAAIEAQRQGAVRFIGMSGHARPNVLAMALERFPFDAVMVALGAMDTLVSSPETFFLPAAERAGCGVAGMKVLGGGRMTERPDLAIRHTLGLGAHTAVLGSKTIQEVDVAVRASANIRPLEIGEREELFALARHQVHGRDNPPFWQADAEVLAYRPGWIGAAAG